jgi:hypothetical protein
MTKKKTTHRFGEFDLLKAIAVLGLPVVHLMEEGVEHDFLADGVLHLEAPIVALSILGPSIFMMCMGFGMGGTRTSPESSMKQGLRFLLLGALLNVFRWLLPEIVYIFLGDPYTYKDLSYCLASDIYYFVGLFFIFYSLMRRLKLNTAGVLLVSMIMLTVNTLLTPVLSSALAGSNVALVSFVGNFAYVDGTSCFPLLSWAIFPTVGILLGEVLKKTDAEGRERIMRRFLLFAPVVFFSFLSFFWLSGADIVAMLVSPLNAYVTDLPNVILMVSLALFLLGVLYYLCRVIEDSRFMGFMRKISTYIVPFYLLQWVLVSWVIYAMLYMNLPEGSMSLLVFLLTVAAITGICLVVTVKHGMACVRFLAKITSPIGKRRRKTRTKI